MCAPPSFLTVHELKILRGSHAPRILDNRTLTLVRDMDLTRAVPELVLDHEGVKRFVRTGHSHGNARAT